MQSIFVFLDMKKVADPWWGNPDASQTKGVCHVI